MNSFKWVDPVALEILHEEQLAEHGGLAGVRDEGLLDSALARPQNLHAYGEGDVFALAAAYAFGLVRNHPYLDGNKRAGLMAALVFLRINEVAVELDVAEAALKTIGLAAGDIDEAAYAAWLRGACVSG